MPTKKKALGKIEHFYDKISVATITLAAALKLGDQISIEGHENIVKMKVASMQIDRMPVESAKAKDSIGIKVPQEVHPGDVVYLDN